MSSVLYDAPGPRAKRNALIGSIIGAAVIVGLIAIVIKRLADRGQFAAEKWDPLINPSDPVFSQVWNLLRSGFQSTLTAAVLAIVLSLVFGVLLGTIRMSLTAAHAPRFSLPNGLRWLVVIFIELARATPVVLMIYFVAQVFPQFNIRLSADGAVRNLWYLVIALTLYNSVIISEILRAGVNSLPSGQREAGLAIGLTPLRTLQLIQLPQAFRVMLPALISQLVVTLKDTSLAAVALVGFTEALNQGKVVTQALHNPIQVYFVIGLIFILLNYLLGKLAGLVERKLAKRTAGGHVDVTAVGVAGGTDQAATTIAPKP